MSCEERWGGSGGKAHCGLGSVALSCLALDVQAEGPGQDWMEAGPSRWRMFPEPTALDSGGPGLSPHPALLHLLLPLTPASRALLPVHLSCGPGAPIPFRPSTGGWVGSSRKPPTPQALL